MTQREAHRWLEEKQRMMTQYRHLFSSEDVEANGMAILALEKQEKYAWHDLRKNPEDLPKVGECVVTKLILNSGKTSYCIDMPLDERGLEHMKTGLDGYFRCIAWRYIEPFEEDNE